MLGASGGLGREGERETGIFLPDMPAQSWT
eukprot:COSAG03_NODE_19332_length_338_cov_2.334728_1_plen_29_part_01